MADTKIKRGAGARKRPTVTRKTPRKSAAKRPSLWARFKSVLPVTQQTLDRIATVGAVGIVGGLLVAGATWAGVPQYAGRELAQAVGRAGFEVKRVEVTGIDRMEKLTVYAIALDQHSMAMPLVDLDKVRNQLLAYGWIEDARVSRRLPDTLVVDIVERKPRAIWQHNQKLSLIDAKGIVLAKLKTDEPTPDLPLLIGADANEQAVAFTQLMERAPALKSMVSSATWVGNRRWDLGFQTGETLALPEGEEAAGRSLLRFARVEGVQHLLGGRYIWFDMRTEGKMTARFRPKQGRIDDPDGEKSETRTESAGPAKQEERGSGPA